MVLMRAIEKTVYAVMEKMNALENELGAAPKAHRAVEASPSRVEIFDAMMAHEGDLPLSFGAAPYMMSSLIYVIRGLRGALDSRGPVKTTAPDGFLREVEKRARSLGAAHVGYARVPEQWVFRNKGVLYGNAIVLTYEMDKPRVDLAPSKETGVMVQQTYNSLGVVTHKLSKFLRDNGYGAMSGHPAGGQILYPPMAQAAGIGWMSMSGLMLTPDMGPRVRVGAVFTSIENLPFYAGDEHAWIADYCDLCRLCVAQCPGEAILGEPVSHPENGTHTCIDNAKCFPWFIDAYGCSVCVKVCPFSRPRHAARIKARFLDTRRVLTAEEVAALD